MHTDERRENHLFSSRSVLLPTSMMMTSLPLSVLTSSIHLQVCWKEFTSVEAMIFFFFMFRCMLFIYIHILYNGENVIFLLTCNVIDDHSYCRVTYVTWDEASETLLSSCVPQLKSHLRTDTHRTAHIRRLFQHASYVPGRLHEYTIEGISWY